MRKCALFAAAALAACLLATVSARAQEPPNTGARLELPPLVQQDASIPQPAGPMPPQGGAMHPTQPIAQSPRQVAVELPSSLGQSVEQLTSPEGISSTLRVMLTLSVLSMAPAVLLMTTCFVRIVVVLGLLKQALGTQQLPPAQVMTAAALFLTLLVMWPVWRQTYDEAVVPYTRHEMSAAEAWQRGSEPIRRFMSAQIERTGNGADVWLFYRYLPEDSPEPQSYSDVPLVVLLPAFMLSELKTAFLIGFQIYLPFVVIDLVIASVTVAMGMLMLPPALISLPFKLLLFVLVDGWHLVVEMLMQSFQR